ncbi:MAG: hypothetical protein KIG49_00555 [Eubacteriales bacterium]|nr:hypothetical protein [Eubacteriales bacterium]
MKVCKFCGAENQDSAADCSSCGGNEFKHKCGNCGQYLKRAISAPNVALKQGQKQKNALTAEQNTFLPLARTVAIPTKLVILPLYMRIQPPNLSKREKLGFGFWAGFSFSLSRLQF